MSEITTTPTAPAAKKAPAKKSAKKKAAKRQPKVAARLAVTQWKSTGDEIKSRMMRVDLKFAQTCARAAKARDVTITEITRELIGKVKAK